MIFVDLFNHIPSNAKEIGNLFERHQEAKVKDHSGKGFEVALLTLCKMNGLSPTLITMPALLLVSVKDDKLGLETNGRGKEGSFKSAVETKIVPSGTAVATTAFVVLETDMVIDHAIEEFGPHMLVVFHSHGVVQVACRHRLSRK